MPSKPLSPAEMRARGYDPDTIARAERDEEARKDAAMLIDEIAKAFAAVPRPRITLHVARGFDDEWILSEERMAELAAKDPEHDWSEVPDEAIESYQEYLAFSDGEGWRFYLPAFMCHYLRRFPRCAHDAIYEACLRKTQADLLTPAQLACLERFLGLCHRYET